MDKLTISAGGFRREIEDNQLNRLLLMAIKKLEPRGRISHKDIVKQAISDAGGEYKEHLKRRRESLEIEVKHLMRLLFEPQTLDEVNAKLSDLESGLADLESPRS